MIIQIIKSAFMALGVGVFLEFFNQALGSAFLHTFLSANLITILIALLAINATTMGIVLTKVRDLIDRAGNLGDCFSQTKRQMLLSVKEQIGLVVIAIILLSVKESAAVTSVQNVVFIINSMVIGVFVYALNILYDTAKGVMIIVDY